MKKIMVVDDDPYQTFTIKKSLERLDNNYEVIQAYGGIQCFEFLSNKKIPDLILLDIMMPNLSGWDVAAKIKENPEWKSIPIVFLTAKGDTMSIGMGGLASEDYIVKPFDIQDLKLRVEKIINKV